MIRFRKLLMLITLCFIKISVSAQNNVEQQQLLKTAEQYFSQGQFDQALNAFLTIEKQFPADDSVQLKIGTLYTLTNQYKKSEEYYIEKLNSLSEHRKRLPFLMNLGLLYSHQLKNPEKAKEMYIKAIELFDETTNPGLISVVLNNYGLVFLRTKELKKAEELFIKSLKYNENSTLALYNIAELYSLYPGYNNFEKAAVFFQKAYDIAPNEAKYDDYIGWIRSNIMTSKFDKAKEIEMLAENQYFDMPGYHFNIGSFYGSVKVLDKAYFNLTTEILVSQGIEENVINATRNVLRSVHELLIKEPTIKSGQVVIAISHGLTLKKENKFAEAINVFETILEQYSKNIPTLMYLGETYYTIQQYDKALEIFKIGQELAPKFAPAFWNSAKVYRAQGKMNEALKYYRLAIQASPHNWSAKYSQKAIEEIESN